MVILQAQMYSLLYLQRFFCNMTTVTVKWRSNYRKQGQFWNSLEYDEMSDQISVS